MTFFKNLFRKPGKTVDRSSGHRLVSQRNSSDDFSSTAATATMFNSVSDSGSSFGGDGGGGSCDSGGGGSCD